MNEPNPDDVPDILAALNPAAQRADRALRTTFAMAAAEFLDRGPERPR